MLTMNTAHALDVLMTEMRDGSVVTPIDIEVACVHVQMHACM